jgi:hypothetical protein
MDNCLSTFKSRFFEEAAFFAAALNFTPAENLTNKSKSRLTNVRQVVHFI